MVSFTFLYYDRDHLGNNREVVDANGTVRQVTNYYPFGTPYADATAAKGAGLHPYKYNGKELDQMHGLNTYDYGARQYDPALARWDRVDPLAEKYYSISPYAYCAENPVNAIDVKGKYIYYLGYKGGEYRYIHEKGFCGFFDSNKHFLENKDTYHIINAIDEIRKSRHGSYLLSFFDNSDQYHVYISINSDKKNRTKLVEGKALIEWDPKSQDIGILERNINKSPSFLSLAHELFHAKNFNTNSLDYDLWVDDSQAKIPWEEYNATLYENRIRSDLGLLKRTFYAEKQNGVGYAPSAIPFEKSDFFTMFKLLYALWKNTIHF